MSANEAPMAIDLGRETDFALGTLQVRPSSREVLADGGKEVLEPRVMQVLVALARARGAVVSRDQLVVQCWTGRVVGEDAINRCIARVRRLAEAHGGFTIETIARVGYRLTEGECANARSAQMAPGALSTPGRKGFRTLIIVVASALVLGAMIYLMVAQRRDPNADRDLRARTLIQIANLVHKDLFGAAFTLAAPLMKDARMQSDADFMQLWRQIVLPMRPLVSEAGATVYFKPYEDVDGKWVKAGTTPLAKPVDAPRGSLRIKVEKPGFRTGYFVAANPGPSLENDPPIPVIVGRPIVKVTLPLIAQGTLPDDMVLVPRTDVPVYLGGWSTEVLGNDQRDIPAFGIGRSEVTNQQFKEFIDAGGYDIPAYWDGLKFEENGRELSWVDARKRFVDSTRRPGPAGWQVSTYPAGQADQPVGGISWYEAVAYARFRGEALPTIHHWVRAAFAPYEAWYNTAPAIATLSRFSADGPKPAQDGAALGPWGTVNMAGNVREWVWNFSGNEAVALGGAWSDNATDYQLAYSAQPFQRLPQNGLRLMHILPGTTLDAELLKPIRFLFDNPALKREPVSDEAFAAMRFQFATAHVKPIDVTVQEIQQSALWVVEEVTLRFQHADTATIYIVRPKVHRNPLQPII
ncbi:MAG TPA: SUMF1/EgtB/PvdO family nonheme iron enzyme, partial [Steroidobacteraceae bacterium]